MAPSRLLLQLFPSVTAIRLGAPRSLSYAVRPRYNYSQPETKRPGIVMANVTKANFREACEQLQTYLQTADFVALDFEMTGVETAPWRRHSELDTCETRYQHIKNSAESFAVWQCGVCPFKWDENGQKFVAYPYNFYIFPRNELPVDMPSRSYFCQTSSLEFLAKHHFDFNATVYNGISYLSLEQEKFARVKLGLTEETKNFKRQQTESESEIPLNRTADVVFSERVRVQLGQWRDGLMRNKLQWQGTIRGVGGSKDSTLSSQTTKAVSLESPVIEASGSEGGIQARIPGPVTVDSAEVSSSLRPSYYVDIFGNNQARLVKQVLRKHYPDLVPVVIKKPYEEEKQQVRIIFTYSNEDKAKLQKELELEEMRGLETLLSNAVGFRSVIDAIKASGKPLIGHNCLLDLAHLHDKFFGPLPSSVKGFSTSILRHFACVLDTKYLLKAEPTLRDANLNKNTSLAIAYQDLCHGFSERIPKSFYMGKPKVVSKPMSRVKLEIASELQRYSGGLDTGLKHEAGFDAYMTGAIFAQICHVLQVDVSTIRHLPDAAAGASTGFASYANLMMLQTFRGQSALDLTTGNEAVGIKAPRGLSVSPFRLIERDNVALFWGPLPARGLEEYLRNLVRTIFAKDSRLASVDVYPVDGSSAFVEFRSSTILEDFFRGASRSLSVGVSRDAFPLKAARFEAYERICRSPLATQSLAMAADLLEVNQLGPDTVGQGRSGERQPGGNHVENHIIPSSAVEAQTAMGGSTPAFEVECWGEQVGPPLQVEVAGRIDRHVMIAHPDARLNQKHDLNSECTSGEGGHSGSIDVRALNEVDDKAQGNYTSADASLTMLAKEGSDEDYRDLRAPKRLRSGHATKDSEDSNV